MQKYRKPTALLAVLLSLALLLTGCALPRVSKLDIIREGDEYPESLKEFAEKYEQVVDFVYDYPKYRDRVFEIDLTREAKAEEVPLLLQWDRRWGYLPYGTAFIGNSGCGPVCLSMAALYLTRDPQWSPDRVAALAVEHGYRVPNQGTSWSFISEGCALVGLRAESLSKSESAMTKALEADRPIIANVGPGDFTKSGHFIVIRGREEGGFLVNDPNSPENSGKVWPFDVLAPQIRKLWAMSAAE